MRVALVQSDPLIGDCVGIAAAILARATEAAKEGADLAVFPELAAIGYPPRDLLERRRLIEAQEQALAEIVPQLPLPCVIGCVDEVAERRTPPRLANAALFVDRGEIRARYRKRLLPTYDVFDERRYFLRGEAPVVVEVAGRRVALTICEDIWNRPGEDLPYLEDPVVELADRCDLIVNCSASPYHYGKVAQRQRILADAARTAKAPVVYVNQVGGNDELLFDGGSRVVRPDGSCVGIARRWHEDLVVVDVDGDGEEPPAVDDVGDLREGLELGIRDYCRKTAQESVVLGLSGGIDSAVCAAIAARALGPERVTGLLMPGPHSSEGSVRDAEATARMLGIRAFTCPIDGCYDAATAALEPVFAGFPANVAEENLQSRLRGTLVMAFANKHRAMALTTGNKSELAVGYCTIYGDMNGGLAPLADCYKQQVFALAGELNRHGEQVPRASIDKPPSAELAPGQIDSDSLPPYEVLDRILEAYLETDCGPQDLIERGENPEIVRRIVRLVEVNEHKRRQAAPALKISPKAFGIGRRMPLARRLEP